MYTDYISPAGVPHMKYECDARIWESAVCVGRLLLETSFYVTVMSSDAEWDSCSVS